MRPEGAEDLVKETNSRHASINIRSRYVDTDLLPGVNLAHEHTVCMWLTLWSHLQVSTLICQLN